MSIADYNSPVPYRVLELINKQGLKQKVIAERVGMSVQQFNDVLNGRRLLKVSEIPPIASALHVTPNDLFTDVS